MFHLATSELTHLLTAYGYWAVLLFVAIESMGIPFPGETMLLVAAIYAGTTHRLSLPLVIVAAASGAILGDNLGYWIGREGGSRLLRRYGCSIRLDERKLKLGQYLFRKHGGKVVFFGRFIAVLRTWAAFLAGVNRMPWASFLLFNALGGIIWATLYGLGGYILGENIHRLTGPIGLSMMVLGLLTTITSLVYVRRNEQRLEEEAEHAFPGPLDEESIYFLLTDHLHDDRNRAPRNYLNPDCIIYQEIASIARINRQIEALPFDRMYFRQISGIGRDLGFPQGHPCTPALHGTTLPLMKAWCRQTALKLIREDVESS
jgi:membrane protein DedA with SNARE-associated domain